MTGKTSAILAIVGCMIASAAWPDGDATRQSLEAQIANTGLDPTLRMEAVCNLAGVANADSVPVLIALVEKDLEERRGFWACAIPILGEIGDRRAIQLLKRIGDLNEEHLAGMDHMAIQAVANMANADDVGYLERKAYVWPVRAVVFQALARIGADTSIDILISGLDDGEDVEIVIAATEGLIGIGAAALSALDFAAESMSGAMSQRAGEVAQAIRSSD